MLGIAPPDKRGSNREVLCGLAEQIGPDNVHLTGTGRKNVGMVVCRVLADLRDNKIGKDCSAVPFSGTGSCAKVSHFWRGFISPVGSQPDPDPQKKKSLRHHPYAAAQYRKKRQN
jgi:hypothetical protein